MKKYILIFLCLITVSGSFAQMQDFKFKFYGQIRTDFYYNSRANEETVDGLFYMYPKDKVREMCIRDSYYFTLVECWGDVPFKTTSTEDAYNLSIPRTDKQTIYDFIIKEMYGSAEDLKSCLLYTSTVTVRQVMTLKTSMYKQMVYPATASTKYANHPYRKATYC